MNSKLAFVLGLATGAAVGAVVSWRINKVKYQKIMEEEISSMREVLSKKAADSISEEAETTEETEVELPDDVADAMRRYDRVSEEIQNGGKIVMGKHPYVISPEEYGDMDGYTQETLTLYADNVITYYATDELVEDVDKTIGSDSLTHFGEYEDDAVYVRNDALKTDFEILRDTQKYSEVQRSVLSDTTED